MISKVNVGNVYVANQNISRTKNENIQNKEEVKSKDRDKVQEIKKSIQDGTYKIDLQKTAEKIAGTLL